jgi:hypothetical protein
MDPKRIFLQQRHIFYKGVNDISKFLNYSVLWA